jgi:hypothetical protein
LANIALSASGMVVALGLVELLLRSFPTWLPGEVRVSPPVRRIHAYVDETYDVRPSDGDLFHWMRGAIAPVPPDQDAVMAQVHLVTDGRGFRNPHPELGSYAIVTLGDSFTRASSVATPWPQGLSERVGMSVLNLGEDGAGPQQELEFLRQFGMDKEPRWVILAFCEANDLHDAAAYVQARPSLVARYGRYLWEKGPQAWLERTPSTAQAAVEPSYRYPITVSIDGANLDMAFFSAYVSWLTVSGEAMEASREFQVVTDSIREARDLSEGVDARFLLVYVPSKEHVYLPYLDEGETASRVFAGVTTLALGEAGFLEFTSTPASLDLARQHMDDQASLLAAFAEEQGVAFLDLTPTFQEEAGAGAELYYPYDTHWNQRGHDLAAQTIADLMLGPAAESAGEGPGG